MKGKRHTPDQIIAKRNCLARFTGSAAFLNEKRSLTQTDAEYRAPFGIGRKGAHCEFSGKNRAKTR